MMSNGSIINVETKTIGEQNGKIAFNTLGIYITIYHTYLLLYRKGHNSMISNNSTINVDTIELTK